MELISLFAALSIGLFILGFIPYIFDIHNKKVKPHILSWLGWGFIMQIGAFAMFSEGSTWVALVIALQGLICFVIAGYSHIRKVGVLSASKYDYFLFTLGVVGIILWQITGIGVLAIIFAIIADFCFGLPTIIKTFNEPTSETRYPWVMAVLSDLFTLLTIQVFVFHEFAYPFYIIFYDAIVLVLVLQIIKKRKK